MQYITYKIPKLKLRGIVASGTERGEKKLLKKARCERTVKRAMAPVGTKDPLLGKE